MHCKEGSWVPAAVLGLKGPGLPPEAGGEAAALPWALLRGAQPGAAERSLSTWSVHHGMAWKEDGYPLI